MVVFVHSCSQGSLIVSQAFMAAIITFLSNSLMLVAIILVFIRLTPYPRFRDHLQGHICHPPTMIIVIKSASQAAIDPLSAALTPQAPSSLLASSRQPSTACIYNLNDLPQMNTTATSYEAQLAQDAHSQDPTRATNLPPGPPRSNPLGPQTHPDSFLSQEGPRVQRWGRSRQEIKYILSSGPFVQVTLDFWASQLNE